MNVDTGNTVYTVLDVTSSRIRRLYLLCWLCRINILNVFTDSSGSTFQRFIFRSIRAWRISYFHVGKWRYGLLSPAAAATEVFPSKKLSTGEQRLSKFVVRFLANNWMQASLALCSRMKMILLPTAIAQPAALSTLRCVHLKTPITIK